MTPSDGRARSGPARHVPLAAGLAVLVFTAFNLNGREIGSYDSQPLKYTACAIVLHGTLTLDRVTAQLPALAKRPGFARAADGHTRSAYSVVPAILAAGPAWALSASGLVDLNAPDAPSLVAKLSASLLCTLAVVLGFYAARWRTSDARAFVVAIAFGLGTNVWATASQTLWQAETTLAGLALAVLCLAPPAARLTTSRLWLAALGLGIAGAARAQLTPAVLVLALAITTRRRRAGDVAAVLPIAALGGITILANLAWFGHPLGGAAILETLHPGVHGVAGTFSSTPWVGAAGLLISPSRGLLVFSPIVLTALAGLSAAWREGWRGDLAWCALAAFVQFSLYSSYTVWWGGHTFGPRYMIDILPLLVPLAAAGTAAISSRPVLRWAVLTALAWSMVVAATGAFCYPNDRWNTDPDDVDRDHQRLWAWRDPQIVRCWTRGPSPQDFDLFPNGARRR